MIEAKVMEAMAYNQSWQPPSGWKVKSLSQVATTKSGGTPSRRNPRYFNGNIPWIKSGELEDDWILGYSPTNR